MNIIALIRRFVPPYKNRMVWNILFNLSSTILSLFSFAAIIPVLYILFGLTSNEVQWVDMQQVHGVEALIEAARNNMYYLLNEQIATRGASVVLLMVGLFLVIMTGIKCGTAWLANYHMVPLRTGVLRDLRKALYDKILSLPIGYFTEARRGDVISRMTNDVNEVEASIMSALDILFKNPVMILVYLITLLCISWQLTLFVLLLMPIAVFLIGRIGRSLKKASSKGQEQNAEILSSVDETLLGLRVVKGFNAQDKLRNRFEILINATRATFNRINRRYYLAHPLSEFLGTALIAVILWFGGLLILNENTTIDAATFIYYLVIFYSIINPAKDLSKASYSIRKGMASLERIDAILNTQSNIHEPNEPQKAVFERQITFENISFAYQADRDVLRDINLTIPKGHTVALVGQSGSGKTTLTDLLPRFYDPTQGAVTIDGVDVRRFSTYDLRALMGIVSQEPILFNDTIYNNITFGVDLSSPAPNGMSWQSAVEQAAKVANAHEFIMQTENGYETVIGDRGTRLSGGQKQRLSIARAILKNPPILILDEATSALDTESERLVQEALENLMKERTSLVVAHRLSTIKHAHLICVMHEGQIVERGTHDQLYALNGYYTKLVDMQRK
ncbi:MAG: ABC transporter ATP-binding protein [Paludibacteraceae bacterium]|nr:ABC transporter ATP-binding protein [Paludibacteraceae bacterium]